MKNFKIIYAFLFSILLISCRKEDNVDLTEQKKTMNDKVLVTLKSGVVVEKSGDNYIYLGDILLSKDQFKLLDETGSIFPADLSNNNKPNYIAEGTPINPIFGQASIKTTSDLQTLAVGRHPYENAFWSMLRFTFSHNLNDYQKQSILDAIEYIENQTNARFYNANGQPTVDPQYGFHYPYVEFTASNVNNSNVGRIGGKQIINLVDFDRGTIIHEICHALGMYHEQCRTDRDNHITIHYSNIIDNAAHNFRKETRNYYMIGQFDFNSIMMYSPYAFSKNPSQPTITKKDGSTYTHNRYYLSESDRRFINTFYLPFKVRQDVCMELDEIVYDHNNNILTPQQKEDLERRLNFGRCNYPLP